MRRRGRDVEVEGRAGQRGGLLAEPHVQLVLSRRADRVLDLVGAHDLARRVQRARVDAAKGECDAARVGRKLVRVRRANVVQHLCVRARFAAVCLVVGGGFGVRRFL